MKEQTNPIKVTEITDTECLETCIYYECSETQKEQFCANCEFYTETEE